LQAPYALDMLAHRCLSRLTRLSGSFAAKGLELEGPLSSSKTAEAAFDPAFDPAGLLVGQAAPPFPPVAFQATGVSRCLLQHVDNVKGLPDSAFNRLVPHGLVDSSADFEDEIRQALAESSDFLNALRTPLHAATVSSHGPAPPAPSMAGGPFTSSNSGTQMLSPPFLLPLPPPPPPLPSSSTVLQATCSTGSSVLMAPQGAAHLSARPGFGGLRGPPGPDSYELTYPTVHLEVQKFEGDAYCYCLIPSEVAFRPCGVFLQQHFDRAYAQFSLAQRRGRIRPRRVEVWLNPTLEKRFYEFQDRLKRKGDSLQELFVFHGSSPDRLRSIMFEGFLIGGHDVPHKHGAAYGKGVYTSLCPDDAVLYSKGGRAVMMCLALPGLHSEVEELTSDSWSPRNLWRVFRSPEQLLPMCIVTF